MLAAECGDDVLLREYVERMLEADSNPSPDWQFDAMEAFARGGPVERLPDYTERSFGPYRVVERIGMGGMGVVYKAIREDNEYRQTVAIKILPGGLDSPASVERFRHERQILANLVHPNIARLLDGGTTEEGLPYLVLDFVEGLALDRYAEKTAPALTEKLRLFRRIADAVQFAHRNLVVHCDLKPANILVERDGTPKLLDFGISQMLEEGRGSRTATAPLMTPEYASPEQVLAKPITTATDVYSLGVLLYVLLSGRRPYETETVMTRAVCETSLDTRNLPEELANIIAMATRKEPERRYSSVEQFSSDIGNYLEHRPVMARRDTLRYRAGKYTRRHRVSIAAAGLVAASLLAGAVLSLNAARDAQAARAVAEREKTLAEDRSRQADAARLVAEHEHMLAEQQRLLAEQEAGVARSAQGRSEQRLTDLLQLANKSLFDVHTAIQSLPGATQARHEIVNTTLQYLESLAKESGDDPRLQLALGSAYLRVAEVQSAPFGPSLGDTPGALKSLDKAAEWIRPLLAKQPPDPKVIDAWLDTRTIHAQILAAGGDNVKSVAMLKSLLPDAVLLSRIAPDDPREPQLYQVLAAEVPEMNPAEGIEYAQMAIAGFGRLLKRRPADRETAEALAAAHSNWATAVRGTDLKLALAEFRESARIREDVMAKYPNSTEAQRSLMLAYGHIAGALGDTFQPTNANDTEGARNYYEKSAVIARGLAKADPVNRLAQYDVASVEMRLGALDPKPGGEAESLAALERARASFENLIRLDPQPINYPNGLATTWQYIGNRLRQAGNVPEALNAYKQAVDVSDKTLVANPGYSTAVIHALAAEQAIADVMTESGDRAGAIEYAGRSVTRAEQKPPNPEPAVRKANRLARAYETLATVHAHFSDWTEAHAAAVRSAAEWKTVSNNPGDSHTADVERLDRLIAECDRNLQ